MVLSIYEITWIRQLLMEVSIVTLVPTKVWCDNQVVMYITSNSIFHEHTKIIEIDCYFAHEKI